MRTPKRGWRLFRVLANGDLGAWIMDHAYRPTRSFWTARCTCVSRARQLTTPKLAQIMGKKNHVGYFHECGFYIFTNKDSIKASVEEGTRGDDRYVAGLVEYKGVTVSHFRGVRASRMRLVQIKIHPTTDATRAKLAAKKYGVPLRRY